MADNYLEKKFEEFYSGRRPAVKHPGISLDALLTRTRSCRGYQKDYKVHRLQLERIAGVCCKVASAMNRQPLRFRLVTADDPACPAATAVADGLAAVRRPAEIVLRHLHLGAALPELHLPLPGTEPEAFIVICSSVPEDRYVDMDLGIAAQSMLLKTTEMGLGGVLVCAFDQDGLKRGLALPLDPLAVLAIGKPAEKFELRTAVRGGSLRYFREGGVHIVPKLGLQDLLI
ncbi:MAG: nitroreductase family protein [Bacteroidales bacterium]|nr:nitroreductase family protein [Bacteroidales bacterium]